MEDRDPIFIVYPETYVLYAEALKDKRFDGQSRNRIIAVNSAWHSALQTFGDRLAKLDVYVEEDGVLSWQGFEKGWDGEFEGEWT